MMQRPLVIHVGVQKTGSTSLHHFLQANAAALERVVVLAGPQLGISMRSVGRAAIEFSVDPTRATAQALRNALGEILTQIPDNDLPVLITHENLAGAMPGNSGETRLFPMLPQIAALLAEQAEGFDLRLVYFSREMGKWRESVWAQAVRTDCYFKTLPQFMESTANLPDWDDLTQRLESAIGADRVLRLRLEDEPDPLCPGRQLLRLVGLDDAFIDALTPLAQLAMTRLNAGSLEFLRQLNAMPLNPHARFKVARLVARSQAVFNAEYRPQGIL